MKIEILPEQTGLPTEPQRRRHHPPEGSWRRYRDCLRWDFGFTCSLCMLHEADLSEHGAEGEGMMWIEHIQPRSSSDREQADRYDNCVLSCRFCNNVRQARPVFEKPGKELLDPTNCAWADHFEWQGDSLRPKLGDLNAEHTWSVYQLDHDEKKVVRRRSRREKINASLGALRTLPDLIQKMHQEARAATDVAGARENLRIAFELQIFLDASILELQRYEAVPKDCPGSCRCPDDAEMTLPVWLKRQVQTVVLPDM